MKTTPTPTEVVDLDAGTVDTVPPADLAAAAAPADPDPIVDAKRRPGRPRKTAGEATASKVGRPSNADKLAKTLADQYTTLGAILMIFAPTAGATMIDRADVCAQSLASWAETNPKVRKALERVNTGAGAVSVLIAHAPIAVAVYADITSGRAALPGGTTGDTAGVFDLFTAPTFTAAG